MVLVMVFTTETEAKPKHVCYMLLADMVFFKFDFDYYF